MTRVYVRRLAGSGAVNPSLIHNVSKHGQKCEHLWQFGNSRLNDGKNGGAGRDRTDDLKLAKLPLSQLSYSPFLVIMVGLGRFELPTSPLSGVRSNQLSYRPDIIRTLHINQPDRRSDPTDRQVR